MVYPMWQHAPFANLCVGDMEVHLWLVPLATSSETLALAGALLSLEEAARARRFRLEKDRAACIVGRAVLRTLIARYTGMPPRAIVFEYGLTGKPRLADGHDLHFNIAHSGALALYGFARHCRLGVDIEYVCETPDLAAIADRFLNAGERGDLASISGPAKTRAFYDCWTRKEALLKATGAGISAGLDTFRVSLLPFEPARLLAGDGEFAPDRWSLVDAAPGGNYRGALAIRGSGWHVRACACRDVALCLTRGIAEDEQ